MRRTMRNSKVYQTIEGLTVPIQIAGIRDKNEPLSTS